MIVFREMMLSDVEQISAMEEAYFSMPWSKQALSEAAAGDQTFYMVAEDMQMAELLLTAGSTVSWAREISIRLRCMRLTAGRESLQDFCRISCRKVKKRRSCVYVRSAGVKYGCNPAV